MTSNYNPLSESQPFGPWLEQVIIELSEFGHLEELTIKERNWLFTTWDKYDLSPAEAAQSFINETPE